VSFAESLLADRVADDTDSLTTEQLVERCEVKLEAYRAANEAEIAGLTTEQLVSRCEAALRASQRASRPPGKDGLSLSQGASGRVRGPAKAF
jgi:hypothetical protein